MRLLPALLIATTFGFLGSWLLRQTGDLHLMRAGTAAISLGCGIFGYVAGQVFATDGGLR